MCSLRLQQTGSGECLDPKSNISGFLSKLRAIRDNRQYNVPTFSYKQHKYWRCDGEQVNANQSNEQGFVAKSIEEVDEPGFFSAFLYYEPNQFEIGDFLTIENVRD